MVKKTIACVRYFSEILMSGFPTFSQGMVRFLHVPMPVNQAAEICTSTCTGFRVSQLGIKVEGRPTWDHLLHTPPCGLRSGGVVVIRPATSNQV